MYYYVYRITNKVENKHYYGKRCSKYPPDQDLGIRYFSSSTDKMFIADQKANQDNYKYKIIKICENNTDAVLYEIKLHNKFNVGVNTNFYNRAKQTSVGFDTTGIPLSQERKEKCKFHFLGRKHTAEAINKCRIAKRGNSWNKGRTHSEQAIDKMKANCKKGKEHPNAVLVDVYSYLTDVVIASNVVLNEWCKDDKSLRSNLAATLKADRNKPSSKYNPWQSKGMYAKYSSV